MDSHEVAQEQHSSEFVPCILDPKDSTTSSVVSVDAISQSCANESALLSESARDFASVADDFLTVAENVVAHDRASTLSVLENTRRRINELIRKFGGELSEEERILSEALEKYQAIKRKRNDH